MTKLLILIVVVLGILAVAQLARVYELTSKLSGKREEDISPADNRMNATLMWVFLVAYFAFFAWLVFAYQDKLLPVAASTYSIPRRFPARRRPDIWDRPSPPCTGRLRECQELPTAPAGARCRTSR